MMNRHTGAAIALLAHITQSIADIITTPLGSRVMRRDYGCLAFELVDQPDNKLTQARVFASAAAALMRWEPRLQASRITATRSPETPGAVVFEVRGDMLSSYAAKARPVRLVVAMTRGGQ